MDSTGLPKMTNKYLKKIAGAEIDVAGSGVENKHKAEKASTVVPVEKTMNEKQAGLKDWYKTLDTTDKVKLGMSATGLALGTTGFIMNHQRLKNDERRNNVEQQSLTTLQKIHAALAKKDKPE